MRSMQWQLGIMGTISAFAYRHRENKKTQGNQETQRNQEDTGKPRDTRKPRRHRETKKTQGNQEDTGKSTDIGKPRRQRETKRHRETKKTHGNQERPGTHCIGGWVVPRTGLDRCGKSRPHQDSIPGPSSPQRVAIPTELSRPTYASTYCSFVHLRKRICPCRNFTC